MRYQWKLLLLLLILAIGPIAVMRPFGLDAFQNLGQTLVARTQESLLRQIEDRLRLIVEGYSEMLHLTREQALISIELQAQEAQRLLARPPTSERPLFIAGLRGNKGTEPVLVTSDRYFERERGGHLRSLPVSYTTPVFKFSPGVDPTVLEADCQRLAGMATLWRTVATREDSPVLWHFVTMESGIHLVFPGHDSFPRLLDPRERFTAKGLPAGEISWIGPYVDPVTRQVVTAGLKPIQGRKGEVVGVTGMVIALGPVLERPFLADNLPAGTVPYLCQLERGESSDQLGLRIVARQEYADLPHRLWGVPIDKVWIRGDDATSFAALLADVAAGKGNMRRLGWQGTDSLWTYGATHQGMVLVLITPYETIHRLTAAAVAEAQVHVAVIARSTLLILSVVCAVAVILAALFSKTVTRPLKRLSEGAQRLAAGDFKARVDIRSADEFGQMAKVFNQVGPQLEAHYDLRRSLNLAREVQQNLLPEHSPQVHGLDVCGQSRYCDQTGGDYYDYLVTGTPDSPRLVVIVGDVAGHGISSALLMATARALIRQRFYLEGDLSAKLADVNRLLCRDVGDSGQFMTLFLVEISALDGELVWVRAGHEPGWCYTPGMDRFDILAGQGLPVGVIETAEFPVKRRLLAEDEVLVVGTDGIWETLDPQGRMYGKARLEALLRKHVHRPACRIVEAVMADLEAFRQGADSVDDATLVVVKRTSLEKDNCHHEELAG
jgi:phosphoserine phosphatase RsbU/P